MKPAPTAAPSPAPALSSSTDEVTRVSLDIIQEALGERARLDPLYRKLYAQDASIYHEEPLGVIFPRDREELIQAVRLAAQLRVPLIPRAAGTSLAGQCVGGGLVVDTGRHMNEILEINAAARWVRVQPGVILDDLNRALKPHGLQFAPDTSTANRCMIGGMMGNNSCGSHSILYGTTRDHVLEMDVALSDGAVATIRPWSDEELAAELSREDALGEGLRALDGILRERGAQIRARYPHPSVRRRNTGYALDEVLDCAPYTEGGRPFDLIRLLCGSEGTLAVTLEAKLNLVPLPKHKILVCGHFDSLDASLRATVMAVAQDPAAVELIDKRILDLAAENIEQRRNRAFLIGDPEAILAVEFYRDTLDELDEACAALIASWQEAGLGYAFPIIRPPQDRAVWELRKAGLGILMGVPGDVKPATIVEDTAVAVEVLPDYIAEFEEIMDAYGARCVYYAHASVGELHLRPEINLKDPRGLEQFRGIARDVTDLVVKYRGSISGEHGDGRLRGPLLEQFYGAELMQAHRDLKDAFDPHHLLNPDKIVDTPPMDEGLRMDGVEREAIATHFDWSADQGLLRAVEKCNGAGACRKRPEAGGTMCPSYMVTLDEKDSTRGRANVFRNLLLDNATSRDAFASEELYEALDLCLSCKGCKSECPANVDMGRMKAEFLQHHHDIHGAPLSARMFAAYGRLSRWGALVPWLANFVMTFALTRWLMGKLMKLSPERALPAFAPRSFDRLWRAHRRAHPAVDEAPLVWLYVDPFTRYTEPHIAMAAARVLEAGGWRVEVLPVDDDGRTYLSKGFLREAREVLHAALDRTTPLLAAHPDARIVGLEPSALLTFRDEALDLVDPARRAEAEALAARSVLLDEFIVWAHGEGGFDVAWSLGDHDTLTLHGHCHQKALTGTTPTVQALQLAGYVVDVLPTGCCGMAGSFGYEADHHELSMQVGELVLFPSLRALPTDASIVAPGTSCRHQIMDGVSRVAQHPAMLLERALPPTSR